MVAEWAEFCRTTDLAVEDSSVVITFADGRRHRVAVEEDAEEYLLRAFVARQSTVASLPDLPLKVWSRNRVVSLMGFRIDHRGRLVGEAWVPKVGITAREFQLYLRTVAVEADRFEYTLTGRDSE